MEAVVYLFGALMILGGALGVVLNRNTVHAALSLLTTLGGVALMFIAQSANFLAAVQVIVYAGAIVVLFLFVIMLLGVDRLEDMRRDPLVGQRPIGVVAGLLLGAGLVFVVLKSAITGDAATFSARAGDKGLPDVTQIAHLLFTDYLFAFEVTSLLLVIAVVGAVLLARRRPGLTTIDDPSIDDDEPVFEAQTEEADY